MNSLYQAYQAYERRVSRGELTTHQVAVPQISLLNRLPITYRLGKNLVRLGLKLERRALAGHALTSLSRAEK
jgi:hypothetical protein